MGQTQGIILDKQQNVALESSVRACSKVTPWGQAEYTDHALLE